jgi:hypothetical protein
MFGGIVEREIFGDMRKPENPIEGFPGPNDYVKFNEAMRYVRNHQRPGNPENPKEFFPHDLLNYLRSDEELKEVASEAAYRFNTAIGSHLDRFHGIDALIECKPDPEKNQVFIVTLDVTTNPGKEGGYKADVLISLDREGLDPTDPDYQDIVVKYGREIKDQLLTIIPEAVKVKAA